MIKFYRHSNSRADSIKSVTEHKGEADLIIHLANELALDVNKISVLAEELGYHDDDYTHIVLLSVNDDEIGVAGFSSGWFL